jgi:LysR family transcriptional regulator, transcriptional activator of nhaA
MSLPFNYRHLYYFWVVAKAGSMSGAAQRLDMAVQTISTQVHELERDLGHSLLRPAGRGLVLTEAGQAAMRQADQIFALGELLPDLVGEAATLPDLRLRIGISDRLPKLVVHQLMLPVLQVPHLRLVCQERGLDTMLADLALHQLDVVLADHPAPNNTNLKLYNHSLGQSTVAWYAPATLARRLRRGFPQSLAAAPVLLPTPQAALRPLLDRWCEQQGLRPRVVGEFDDSALMKTFGASGMGVFPAATLVEDELLQRYGVQRVGECAGVVEKFFAIGTEKKVQHPLVLQLLSAAR